MQQVIQRSIEQNQLNILDSVISLGEIVKKGGKMTLEPKFKEPDSFLTRVKHKVPFNFCVKIADLNNSTLQIRLDLRSITEVNLTIKQNSLLPESQRSIKHLEIPFSVCMSTINEKPGSCSTDETFWFADSNTVTYKVPKSAPDPWLCLQLKADQDCVLKATASANPLN